MIEVSNRVTIDLFGKKLNLRFGGLAWEYFILNTKDNQGLVKSTTLMIYAAIRNEDEFTKINQEVTFDDVYALVDSAYFADKEADELRKAEKVFLDMNAYKNFLAESAEAEKSTAKSKKKATRKK